jgi:hypothetical protein
MHTGVVKVDLFGMFWTARLRSRRWVFPMSLAAAQDRVLLAQ